MQKIQNSTLPPDEASHDLPTAIYIDSAKMSPIVCNLRLQEAEVEYLMQQAILPSPQLPADYYISVDR